MKVAIFGLSANPPTGLCGHQGIVRYLVNTGHFDEVWVLPVYRHIMKELQGSASFEHRHEMCVLGFSNESTPSTRVKVCKLEQEVTEKKRETHPEERVGTIDILEHIHEHHKDVAQVTLVLGMDTFRDLALGRWKRFDEIPNRCELHVIEREEVPSDFERDPTFQSYNERHAHRIRRSRYSLGCQISSSQLRKQRSWTDSAYYNPGEVHPDVLQYIRDHGLYT